MKRIAIRLTAVGALVVVASIAIAQSIDNRVLKTSSLRRRTLLPKVAAWSNRLPALSVSSRRMISSIEIDTRTIPRRKNSPTPMRHRRRRRDQIRLRLRAVCLRCANRWIRPLIVIPPAIRPTAQSMTALRMPRRSSTNSPIHGATTTIAHSQPADIRTTKTPSLFVTKHLPTMAATRPPVKLPGVRTLATRRMLVKRPKADIGKPWRRPKVLHRGRFQKKPAMSLGRWGVPQQANLGLLLRPASRLALLDLRTKELRVGTECGKPVPLALWMTARRCTP